MPASNGEPRQTRSKTKMSRMKGNTNPICEPFRKKEAQDSNGDGIFSVSDLDDDEAARLCRVAGDQQQPTRIIPLETIGTKNSISTLRKRQRLEFYHEERETPLSEDNHYKDASKQSTTTTIKKRKLRCNDISSNIEDNNNDNDDSKEYTNNGTPTLPALIHGSPLEMKTTTNQQQTDLFSPMSPVPASIANDGDGIFTSTSDNNYNKKEKNQGYVELGEQGKHDSSKHGQQLAFVPDDEDGNFGNDLGAAESNKGDDSGGGDDDEYSNISTMAHQHDQNNLPKESVANLPQDLANSMEWHSDTQISCVTVPRNGSNELHGTIKSDGISLNLKNKENTVDRHMQPVGFFKRVASYIFG